MSITQPQDAVQRLARKLYAANGGTETWGENGQPPLVWRQRYEMLAAVAIKDLLPTTPQRIIPEVLAHEDGDRWYMRGHLDPPLAVLAVVVEQMTNIGPEEAADLLIGISGDWSANLHHANSLLENVHHTWWVDDPANEERLIRVKETDTGAEPWTEVIA